MTADQAIDEALGGIDSIGKPVPGETIYTIADCDALAVAVRLLCSVAREQQRRIDELERQLAALTAAGEA